MNEVDQPGAAGGEDKDRCIDCGKDVLSSQQRLKCDICGFWYHASCEKVADEMYALLCKFDNEPSLQWLCGRCVALNRGIMKMMATMQEHQQSLEEKMNDLAKNTEMKIDALSELLNESLTNREKTSQITVVDTQKHVDDKFDELINTVKQQKIDGQYVQEVVEGAVTTKLHEDLEEREERNRRRTSVIIHGLQESSSDDEDVRQSEDEEHMIGLLHEIKCDNVSINGIVRLGKRAEDLSVKPRPMKVIVASEEQKIKVLKQAKNLKSKKEGGFDKVFIHQDLTPKQRQERKVLVDELKRRKDQGEENLILVNGRIVTKRL